MPTGDGNSAVEREIVQRAVKNVKERRMHEVSTRGFDVLSENPIAGDVRDSFYENFNRDVTARTNSRDTFGIEPEPKHYLPVQAFGGRVTRPMTAEEQDYLGIHTPLEDVHVTTAAAVSEDDYVVAKRFVSLENVDGAFCTRVSTSYTRYPRLSDSENGPHPKPEYVTTTPLIKRDSIDEPKQNFYNRGNDDIESNHVGLHEALTHFLRHSNTVSSSSKEKE